MAANHETSEIHVANHVMLGFYLCILLKRGDRNSTQLAKMSIDPNFVELTADVVRIFS